MPAARTLQARTDPAPTSLTVADLYVPAILAFLEHLEGVRYDAIRSRNIRLGATRSFFQVVAVRDPVTGLGRRDHALLLTM